MFFDGDLAGLVGGVWLSVFDLDQERALARVTEKFDELRQRRRTGSLPSWVDLTVAEVKS